MNNLFSITVGREIGSGGGAIAQKIAEHFNCNLYDKEILTMAAKESGFSEKLFHDHDEHHSRLHNLIFNKIPILGPSNYYSDEVSQGSLFKFQSEVALKEAEQHCCVFVGRGMDYVLREHKNIVRIFIHADMEYKIHQVMMRNVCTENEARRIIINGEKRRAKYYNFYTGQKWGAKEYYDICINSCALGLETTAELLFDFIEKKLNINK